MAVILSILSDLRAIVPVRDPVYFEVLCQGFRINAGSYAQYTLHLGDWPDDGDEFTIRMPDGSHVEFTYVTATPDDSGTQILISGTVDQVAATTAIALAANYFVDQFYQISYNGTNGIVFVPRALGTDQYPTLTATDAPLAFTGDSSGGDPEFAENYSANVQVWFEEDWKSGVFVPRPALDMKPNKTDRRAWWNLRGVLQWKDRYNWPAYGSATPQLQRNLQKRWYLARWEQHGAPPAPQLVVKHSTRIAWFGGSRNIEHNIIDDVFSLIVNSSVPGGTPFLTYRGRVDHHEVSMPQQHYLAWYRRVPKVDDQQLTLQVIVYWTDGTSDTTTAWTDSNGSGWDEGDVILFPTGFNILDLQSLQPTKVAAHYTARVLSHTGTALSELHTFHLVEEDYNELYIEFVNSLGVVESMRCQGEWVAGIETQHEEVRRARYPSGGALPSVQQSDLQGLLRGNRATRKVSTGLMDPGELNALLDILFSPEHRCCDPARETRIPWTLVDAQHVTVQRGNDDEQLAALNLEFVEGDLEMAWSDRMSMPAVPPPDPEGGGEGG